MASRCEAATNLQRTERKTELSLLLSFKRIFTQDGTFSSERYTVFKRVLKINISKISISNIKSNQ